jgi:hypothetical protein
MPTIARADVKRIMEKVLVAPEGVRVAPRPLKKLAKKE